MSIDDHTRHGRRRGGPVEPRARIALTGWTLRLGGWWLCMIWLCGAAAVRAEVQYARDVAPILSRHCFECHGPDAAQRQAGLRLDRHASSTRPLESGRIAVVSGDPEASELLRRVRLEGQERMPPLDAGEGLSEQELKTLTQWIREGAQWESHWAFQPLSRPALPAVDHDAWVRNPIDRWTGAQREAKGLGAPRSADRATLLRRARFALHGIPPEPEEVASFVQDTTPDAWERRMDGLLASPLYGQRWGRHWLDVARYGDSNGGDENHAHPLAYRYRDYVIDAFNQDLPFRAFVTQQLAGDLLKGKGQERDSAVAATGFLAIGMKILAERDKVKMRADLVDEQIDTIGKSMLGLTLACARCHDHKFDPIPTTDYYALAGILHSTQLGSASVGNAEYDAAKAAFDKELAQLKAERGRLEAALTGSTAGLIDRQAESFDRGNVSKITDGYGAGIGVISDPGSQQNFAEFDLQIQDPGEYLLQVRYAAEASRPGRILVDGRVVRERAITQTTGGWYPQHQQWFSEGRHVLKRGKRVIRFESSPLMSHIDRWRLIRIVAGTDVAQALTRIDEVDTRMAALAKSAPQEVQVMAAMEGEGRNVQVHRRGSHLQLGAEVQRGAFSGPWVTKPGASLGIAKGASGRLKLARWMTDAEEGVGSQTARVIANRVWHWHFGEGLVSTPNNFGMQGARPSDPELLDWLACDVLDDDWSLKSLHRRILFSATWQQSTQDVTGRLPAGMRRRRLDVEAIRDSLLLHAGRLDVSLQGGPLEVKSQDPTPEDLGRNEAFYRNSRRRSVYLPVVRSHTYRFFTIFDFPNAATPVGRRDSTTVPTQALLLMNDPFVLEQAQALAGRLLADARWKSADARLEALYQRLFSRSPTAAEKVFATDFLREFAQTPQQDFDAWSALCHTLVSSSEFIYVD